MNGFGLIGMLFERCRASHAGEDVPLTWPPPPDVITTGDPIAWVPMILIWATAILTIIALRQRMNLKWAGTSTGLALCTSVVWIIWQTQAVATTRSSFDSPAQSTFYAFGVGHTSVQLTLLAVLLLTGLGMIVFKARPVVLKVCLILGVAISVIASLSWSAIAYAAASCN